MINVHSDLIQKELPILGVDAFAVLMCITSHINAKRQAWPGIDRLRTMTRLSKDRTYKAIQTLINTGHVERSQENLKGEWGKVVYRVTTRHLSIFMGVSSFEFEAEEKQPLAGNPEHGYPEHGKPEPGNTEHISISQVGSIDHILSIDQEEHSGDFAAAVSEFEEEGEPEPVKAKKQKAPPSSARPPQAENDTYRMFRAWADFAEAKTYMPIIRDSSGNPKMGKSEAGQIKAWATWLTNLEPGQDAVEAWGDYMHAAWQHGGKFIQDNFTPGILLSQRLKIVHAARQAMNGSKEKKNDIYELYGELLRQ